MIQVRVVNGVPPTGDYSFAKYNKVSTHFVFIFLLCSYLLSKWFMLYLFFFILKFLWICLFLQLNVFVRLSGVVQSVDVIRYTDEEYEKYLTDPVCINLRLQLLVSLLMLFYFLSDWKFEIVKIDSRIKACICASIDSIF